MMTQLQRDAIARAQAGDWSLADAMELLAPGRAWHNDAHLLGGFRGHGRLKFFIYGTSETCEECAGAEVTDCPECEGKGDFPCEACNETGRVTCALCEQACKTEPDIQCATCDNTRTLECGECAGTRREECDECEGGQVACENCNGTGELDAVIDYVLDMNGRVVYSKATDETGDGPDTYVDFEKAKATTILHEYHHPPKPKKAERAAPAPTIKQSAIHYGDLAA